MNSELLIATNGFKGTWRAIEYGAWFAQSMRMKVTLLGVEAGKTNIFVNVFSAVSSGGNSLRAMCLLSLVSRAFQTTPIPPSPILLTSR